MVEVSVAVGVALGDVSGGVTTGVEDGCSVVVDVCKVVVGVELVVGLLAGGDDSVVVPFCRRCSCATVEDRVGSSSRTASTAASSLSKTPCWKPVTVCKNLWRASGEAECIRRDKADLSWPAAASPQTLPFSVEQMMLLDSTESVWA